MRIISIDGGGYKGVIPCKILQRLELERPGFLSKTDFYAGTSTGAILSAALADGMDPTDILGLYEQHGEAIFSKRGWLDSAVGGIDEMFRANYGLEELKSALHQFFGDRTLGDLQKKVLLTTIQLGKTPAKVKCFHNFDGFGTDKDVRIIDAVLGSAAAPVYFPAHHYMSNAGVPPEYTTLIDGGLCLNSPSVAAVAKAHKEGTEFDDVQLLSLGCGQVPKVIEGGDWGYKQWIVSSTGVPLLDLMFITQVGTADYVCREMLGGDIGYHRVDPVLVKDIGMDDVSAASELLKVAQDVDLSGTVDWLQTW